MQTVLFRSGRVVALVAVVAAFAPSAARADNTPTCPSSTQDAYSATAGALTGPSKTDLTLTVQAAAGCDAVTVVKHIQIKILTVTGDVDVVQNLKDHRATNGVVALELPRVDRGLR